MKSPNTDKTICIPGRNHGPEEKFREIRHRAKDEENDRHKKTRRDKKEKDLLPKYKIDQKVVLTKGYNRNNASRHYYLAQIIDYDSITKAYFGILLNTTDQEYFEKRIGRLVGMERWWGFEILNIPTNSIKWLTNEGGK